ncbi:endonuclease/exonuclease/phosphatase family protein [Zunongwangia endophytica]|uniref:Endonuclease/exonuclease/phosphatase family protein n=1 Tax=Zunongwangia endophytica TaxID=1808945 RepID=A0ABV8H8Y0_9FLAO|nr:endonuclease/exonuclease/phosphatase family protein [Zunongwangia endophytica]MDN3595761.1 endonuclease/exonuclease/phosphatase family protein [Zunongwangia endophytica]
MKLIHYIFLFFCGNLIAQDQATYEVLTIAFYNTENLFDTENDNFTFDDDRTPEGKDAWTEVKYQLKLNNIGRVLSEIGAEISSNSPEIIGLCEIENYTVLEDLLNTEPLRNKDYKIIHYDSPDRRGIDNALLYNTRVFKPNSSKPIQILIEKNGKRIYTRDILVCTGKIEDENFAFLVNHWPSRSGGEKKSRNYRKVAAITNRKICDSLWAIDSAFKIINMGDFNDDPKNSNVRTILNNSAKPNLFEFYNPMLKLYKKGIGSLAFRDNWNLFDQILISGAMKSKDYEHFQYYKAGIFKKDYLVTSSGQYKGYPFRSYGYNGYLGGFSDHFPVYLHLIKKKNPR